MRNRRAVVLAGVSAVVLAVGAGVASPASAVGRAASRRGPSAVSNAHVQWSTSTKISLAWTTHGSVATLVKLARGTQSPTAPDKGTTVALVKQPRRSITISDLAPGARYSIALFAKDAAGNYARRVSVAAITAPGPVQRLHAYAEGRNTMLQWANPTPANTLSRIVVRYAKGRTAPNRPWHGTNVTLPSRTATTATLTHLAADTIYSASVWALDATGRHSTILAVTFTTSEKPASNGHYAGLVTDTAKHPLAHAIVAATDYRTGATKTTSTASDGRFSLSLPPSSEWRIVVGGQSITGGTSDATGYLPVQRFLAIRSGRTSTETVRLAPGGAITGHVVDSANHPLAGVAVYPTPISPYVQSDASAFGVGSIDFAIAFSSSVVLNSPGSSAADGSFTIKGLPEVALQICFDTSAATVTGGTAAQYAAACTSKSSLVVAHGSVDAGTTALGAAVSGSITGTVTSASGPVAGALVFVDSADSDNDDGGTGLTDTDGSYTISGLAPGRYEVCFISLGVTTGNPAGLSPSCPKGTLTVAAGRATVANARLSAGAALTGRVLGHGGSRLADVTVTASPLTKGDLPGSGVTDSSGHYTVAGLRPGVYTVCFSTSEVTPTSGDPTGALSACYHHREKVSVAVGRVRTGIDALLSAGAAIAGRLTDTTGHPVANALVLAGNSDLDSIAITNASGRYVLGNLSSGRYQICFEAFTGASSNGTCRKGKVTVRAGHTVYRIDAMLTTPSAITVTVRDGSGRPVAGVDATALAACSDDDGVDCAPIPILNAKKDASVVTSAVTDSAGRATLGGLTAGHYAVCAFAYYGVTAAGGPADGYADTCTSHTFSVTVAKAQTSAVSLTLGPAGAITGRVTDGGGHPLGGVTVHVSGSAADNYGDNSEDDFFDTSDALDGGPAPDSVTAADGTYTIRSVIPGAQTVCFDASGATGGSSVNGYLDQCQGAAAGSTTGGTHVTVSAGTTTDDGTFALVAAAGISGKLSTYNGKTSEFGLEVVVVNAASHPVAEQALSGPGTYAIKQLAPGTYYVCALGYTYQSQCWKGVAWPDDEKDPPLSKATKIVLAAGQTRSGIDLTLGKD